MRARTPAQRGVWRIAALIEDWHRVIKSGCRVERLAHASSILSPHPTAPGAACTATLQRELEVLTAYAPTLARKWPPPTTIGAAVKLVAIMGGYMARNNDGPPGHQVMWLGTVKLASMCEGYLLHRAVS